MRQMTDYAWKARQAHQLIRDILMTEWDPIGVADIPEARDEYDAYVMEIYGLLSRRAVAKDIFESLWWVETEHMGLRGNRQRTERVANRLASLVDSVATTSSRLRPDES